MDWIGLIVGAILGVVASGIWNWWRQTTGKHELWFDLAARRLTAEGPVALDYLLDGETVKDPWLVRVHFWAAGRGDIQRADFDEGDPLTISLGARRVGGLEVLHANEVDGVKWSIDETGVLSLMPGLIRHDMAIVVRLVIDGVPDIQLSNNRIADTEVLGFRAEWRKGSHTGRWRVVLGVLLIVAGFGAFIAGVVSAVQHGKSAEAGWAEFAVFPAIFIGSALTTFGALAPRRAQRAVRRLRHHTKDPNLIPWQRDGADPV